MPSSEECEPEARLQQLLDRADQCRPPSTDNRIFYKSVKSKDSKVEYRKEEWKERDMSMNNLSPSSLNMKEKAELENNEKAKVEMAELERMTKSESHAALPKCSCSRIIAVAVTYPCQSLKVDKLILCECSFLKLYKQGDENGSRSLPEENINEDDDVTHLKEFESSREKEYDNRYSSGKSFTGHERKQQDDEKNRIAKNFGVLSGFKFDSKMSKHEIDTQYKYEKDTMGTEKEKTSLSISIDNEKESMDGQPKEMLDDEEEKSETEASEKAQVLGELGNLTLDSLSGESIQKECLEPRSLSSSFYLSIKNQEDVDRFCYESPIVTSSIFQSLSLELPNRFSIERLVSRNACFHGNIIEPSMSGIVSCMSGESNNRQTLFFHPGNDILKPICAARQENRSFKEVNGKCINKNINDITTRRGALMSLEAYNSSSMHDILQMAEYVAETSGGNEALCITKKILGDAGKDSGFCNDKSHYSCGMMMLSSLPSLEKSLIKMSYGNNSFAELDKGEFQILPDDRSSQLSYTSSYVDDGHQQLYSSLCDIRQDEVAESAKRENHSDPTEESLAMSEYDSFNNHSFASYAGSDCIHSFELLTDSSTCISNEEAKDNDILKQADEKFRNVMHESDSCINEKAHQSDTLLDRVEDSEEKVDDDMHSMIGISVDKIKMPVDEQADNDHGNERSPNHFGQAFDALKVKEVKSGQGEALGAGNTAKHTPPTEGKAEKERDLMSPKRVKDKKDLQKRGPKKPDHKTIYPSQGNKKKVKHGDTGKEASHKYARCRKAVKDQKFRKTLPRKNMQANKKGESSKKKSKQRFCHYRQEGKRHGRGKTLTGSGDGHRYRKQKKQKTREEKWKKGHCIHKWPEIITLACRQWMRDMDRFFTDDGKRLYHGFKGVRKGFYVAHHGDPPVQVNSSTAKVRACSGGSASNESGSGTSGSSGQFSGSSHGSGRSSGGRDHSGSQRGSGQDGGSGSGGKDNNKNNNNHSNNSSNNIINSNDSNSQNNNKRKDKTLDGNNFNKIETDKNSIRNKNVSGIPPFTHDEGNRMPPPTGVVEPSLPRPRLDDDTIAMRLQAEENLREAGYPSATTEFTTPDQSENNSDSVYGTPDSTPHTGASGQAHSDDVAAEHWSDRPPMGPMDVSGSGFSNNTHAAISTEQLCDLLGSATNGLPPNTESFNSVNACLETLMHNLLSADVSSSEAEASGCFVCLILAELFRHLADQSHDGFETSCDQCQQILNLMIQHAAVCTIRGREKTSVSRSDLCCKICKASEWRVDKLMSILDRLKYKVKKYCVKVFGTRADTLQVGSYEVAMGETSGFQFTEIPSSSTSQHSGTSFSLGGNIVTTETHDQESAKLHEALTGTNPAQSATAAVNRGVPPPASAVCPSGNGVEESNLHSKLTRKPSQRRAPPAIPPAIVEEEGRTNDDIANVIYSRYGAKGHDPYDTQPTYGKNDGRYDSVPVGRVHDVEQFMSVATRPRGVPGVGEVVFGTQSQLRKVAGFWDKKRDDCERSGTCPYQHREEGVILAEHKERFSILRLRYQKHHQWERVAHLGNGMSGKCHLAIDLKTNFKFCCKKIHLLKYTEEELSLWSEMHNAFIVRLYGAIRHGVRIYIFSEFMDGGSLAQCIEEQKRLGRRLSHWSAINYFKQLLIALAYLQSKNILHEDIKADNIVLRRDSTQLALTDFGTSRRLRDPVELKNKSTVGSPTHWSPEKASMEGHGFPSDLWAAVCVLVHMLSGEPPWVKRYMQRATILNFIIYTKSPPMEDVPTNVQTVVRDLIEKGFIPNSEHRPSASELLRHSAFSMIEEVTPETYFSTLVSQSQNPISAAALAKEAAGGQQNQQSEAAATNILQDVPPEVTVLFETTVSVGLCQESDSRADHLEDKAYQAQAKVRRVEDQSQSMNSIRLSENVDATHSKEQEEIGENPGAAEGENTKTQAKGPFENPSGDSQTSLGSSTNSRVHELTEPMDINKFIPAFDDLFASGDSSYTQSIKSFFQDSFTKPVAVDLSNTRQPLREYKLLEKPEQLPILSIFEKDIIPSGTQQDEQEFSAAETICADPQLNYIPVANPPAEPNPPLRLNIQNSKEPKSHVNFHLSSGSDECTSADLFESGPKEVVNHRSSSSGNKGAQSGDDLSPVPSTGSNHSSGGTTLQQKKPFNLKLNVSGNPSTRNLTHSASETQNPSSKNVVEEKRSQTWAQLNTSHPYRGSSSTPSTGRLSSSTPRKDSQTSDPYTGSSSRSSFMLMSGSVRDEQDKALEELKAEMQDAMSMSHTSDESEKLADILDISQKYQPDEDFGDAEENNQDYQSVIGNLVEGFDETLLGGHKLVFYKFEGECLFPLRVQEWPVTWRSLIRRVRVKIFTCGYKHFRILNMNEEAILFRGNLLTKEFKVMHLEKASDNCWCPDCHQSY